MNWARNPETIGQCGVLAALLELSGYPKPGNVHRTENFTDIRYENFLFSSISLLPSLIKISNRGILLAENKLSLNELKLGESILNAVKAAREWQRGGNTQLGIILLFIPLACATGLLTKHVQPSISLLRESLDRIIKHSTSEDTIHLYEAIRLANPGGLGNVEEFDLKDTSNENIRDNNVNLYEISKLSAERDSIAHEWITKFQITCDVGYPYFKRVYEETNDINTSTVHTFLKILGTIPDTLIIRKHGMQFAKEISQRANHILSEGGLLNPQAEQLLWDFDLQLRNEQKINPGTTADLTAATLMLVLLEGMRL